MVARVRVYQYKVEGRRLRRVNKVAITIKRISDIEKMDIKSEECFKVGLISGRVV